MWRDSAIRKGRLYQAFGLLRWEWRQYLNSESILRMLLAWTHGHFTGIPAGDIQRMPGAFLMDHGEIQKAFRHKLVSDRPDYVALGDAELSWKETCGGRF